MKKTLHLFFIILLSCPLFMTAQITAPIIKARFGVDGELRTNFFPPGITGNDDWFNNGTAGVGEFVIDSTGAAAIIAGYNSDVAPWTKRMASFYRTMSRPPFSIVGNRLWLDAIYVRDYHGTDTTVFVNGSNKNGMSPADWAGGIQGVPDKNDILDMMVHVRRAGPNPTDSLWMFGGISLDNITGNRYFDFEMYQTDIYYDRPSGKFYGYGANAGHTAWLFDAAGNITRPGDIIFSGEFQSGLLTNIEARVWVSRSDWQTIVPAGFNYSGFFDGASSGSTYGYASIAPNTTGIFYTGLGSALNAWSGPFGLVLQDNSLAFVNPAPASTTNGKYLAQQFIEFSVNLTKLGLDPVTLLGGDICGAPFNRIVVKTRSSNSFSAELKDFVAPTDLFLAPRVDILSETPIICDTGSISEIHVTNPVPTSFYQWSTLNGNIVGGTTGTSIVVDTPGTYIVTHYLQAGCSPYAADTITIGRFSLCEVLSNNLIDFRGTLHNDQLQLGWKVLNNQYVQHFVIERSFNGFSYTAITQMLRDDSQQSSTVTYSYNDNAVPLKGRTVYYRIKMTTVTNSTVYSNIVKVVIPGTGKSEVTVVPNPVRDAMQVQVNSFAENAVRISLIDQSGKLVYLSNTTVQNGYNVIPVNGLSNQPPGVYMAIVTVGADVFRQKVIIVK
ncbi:MAG TPA: T9SS type A sorting domain-containing protein [Chitinophagaceae bacterium]